MGNRPESIVLGGGCFWCVEAVYRRIKGVTSTRPGYAGGHVKQPSYQQVCEGNTGHAEVVEVSFDPDRVSLKQILDIFWHAHDPTTKNRQGADVGPQYRSVILYADENQKRTATSSRDALAASGDRPPVTEILPLDSFWPAEDFHKEYFEGPGRGTAYCRLVIEPKLRKMSLL